MYSIIAVNNKHSAKLHHVGSFYILTYDARKIKHKMFLKSQPEIHSLTLTLQHPDINAGPSTLARNEHHINSSYQTFPTRRDTKETSKRKSTASATLTHTPVKTASEQEVKAHSKHAKRNRLLSSSQEKSRKSEQLRWAVQRDESSEKEQESECFCTECAEPYSVSRAAAKSF
jgi:flagellar biosynthesis GTPase FlhF